MTPKLPSKIPLTPRTLDKPTRSQPEPSIVRQHYCPKCEEALTLEPNGIDGYCIGRSGQRHALFEWTPILPQKALEPKVTLKDVAAWLIDRRKYFEFDPDSNGLNDDIWFFVPGPEGSRLKVNFGRHLRGGMLLSELDAYLTRLVKEGRQ